MTEAPRVEITQKLSTLVEKRLKGQSSYWASEVTFDRATDHEIRVDYLGFKLRNVHNRMHPSSVELGKFSCYEVKSCMGDFNSGNGLNFIGDANYLVCTRELAEQLREKCLLPFGVDVLVPDKPWTKLITCFEGFDPYVARTRPASEMLWQMVSARGGVGTESDQFDRIPSAETPHLNTQGVEVIGILNERIATLAAEVDEWKELAVFLYVCGSQDHEYYMQPKQWDLLNSALTDEDKRHVDMRAENRSGEHEASEI